MPPEADKEINLSEFAESSHAAHPGFNNKIVDNRVGSENTGSRTQKEQDRKNTEDRIRNQTDEALKAKGRLYESQNVNISKNNPQGNLNNRSFGRTLALSRAADRYNNKPIAPITTMVGGSAVNGLQLSDMNPYDRPRLETEETRQMEKNRRLDEARQMMRAGLQGKVDQWTYDKLSDMFSRLADLNISDDQFRNAVNQYIMQQNVQNAISKDYAAFSNQLRRWGLKMDLQTILDVTQNNRSAAQLTAWIFGLSGAPDMSTISTDQFVDDAARAYMKNHPEASKAEAYGAANSDLAKMTWLASYEQMNDIANNKKKGK